MDTNALKQIMVKEFEILSKLLLLLEDQHDMLLKNEIIRLEEMVERIEMCNKDIAQAEIDRRRLVGAESMRTIIYDSKDEELDTTYRDIQKLIHEIGVQRDTNDMLIKMGLSYSTRMLRIINPDRTQKTYNSYGKVRR